MEIPDGECSASTGRIITLNIKLSYVTHCSADDSHQQLLCNPLLTWQRRGMPAHVHSHSHTHTSTSKNVHYVQTFKQTHTQSGAGEGCTNIL